MSQHADVEAKIAAELDGLGLLASALRPRPRTMAYEDLARLPYLSWVIKVLPRLRAAFPLLSFARHQLKEQAATVLHAWARVYQRGAEATSGQTTNVLH